MKKYIIIGSVLLLSACMNNKETVKPETNSTNKYVSEQMNPVVNDIDRNLNNMMNLDRGSSLNAQRYSSPLGDTIAGQKTPDQKPVPISLTNNLKSTALKSSSDDIKDSNNLPTSTANTQTNSAGASMININEKLLRQKVDLNWNGDLIDLLSQISKKSGFTFAVSEPANLSDEQIESNNNLKISYYAKNKTLENILGDLAKKVNDQADIKVNLINKSITLAYKES